MSFILSGSFHHLRNCLVSHANIRLFRFYSGKSLSRRCQVRVLTTHSELTHEWSQTGTPQSIKLQISKAEVLSHHVESIHCYPPQPNKGVLEGKIDRPVTIFVFDIETTGFNEAAHRIVEFAARDLMGGRNSTFQTLINPKKKILNSHVHGIRNWMVNQPGVPRIEDVIPILMEWVESRQRDGTPVIWVAHNGNQFDFPFLIREILRCGYEIPDDWRFFDTLPFARKLVHPNGRKLKRGEHSLNSLCEMIGIDLEGSAHRAMVDVNRLSYVYQYITFRLKLTASNVEEHALKASDFISKLSQ